MEKNINQKANNPQIQKLEKKVIISLLLVVSILVNCLSTSVFADEISETQEPLNVDPFLQIYKNQIEEENKKTTIADFFSLITSDYEIATISSAVYYSDQSLNGNGDVKDILLARNGNNSSSYLAPSRLYWINPTTDVAHTGYCINPTYAGWNDSGVTYNVDI